MTKLNFIKLIKSNIQKAITQVLRYIINPFISRISNPHIQRYLLNLQQKLMFSSTITKTRTICFLTSQSCRSQITLRNYGNAGYFMLAVNNSLLEQLTDFYKIWPLGQWISSLVGLILLYWITGYFYNKWLSEKGGWLNTKTRILLIVSDLLINFTLGIYYMNHRDTVMGQIMISCPIAISPVIFFFELACVYFYYRLHYTKNLKNANEVKQKNI